MIKNKKASIFLTIFFIAIVLSIFYLIAVQSSNIRKDFAFEQEERAYLGNYAELLKKYGFHS
ncbi:MAG: hypothetical protein NTV63_05920, partial [Candidatus Woesearchaeota archaeon]|nr:hypothetical protein [Candidatus Woesearchaeota archaeon]